MSRLLLLPLLVLAAVLPFVETLVAQDKPPLKAEVRKPVKVAVLIGTNDYTDEALPGLKFCEKDMLKLKGALEPLGFQVILLLGSGKGDAEATRQNIHDTLVNDAEGNKKYAFRDIVAADDIALVAFSGHGQQILVKAGEKETEVPFYCPKRAKSGVPETLVSLNDVLGKLNGGKAHSLLLVDSCRQYTERKDPDGKKSAKGLSLDRSVINGLRKNVGGMFACDDRQTALEHEVAGGGHGLFFFSVLEALRTTPKDDDGVVTWEDLVPRIRKQVTALTAKVPNLRDEDRQQPQPFGNFTASVVLVPKEVIAAAGRTGGEVVEAYTWKGERRTRTVRTLKCGTATMEFVKVPAGKFTMGSDLKKDKDTQANEGPAHEVKFSKALWVAKHPVTKGQFAAFVKAKGYQSEAEADAEGGWGFDGKASVGQKKEYTWKDWGHPNETDKHPVVNVTWNDGAAFCDWMSAENKVKSGFGKTDGTWDLTDYKTPVGVRLLTETEYEYANRGGETTIYITGDKVDSLEGYANIADKSAKAKFDNLTAADFDDGEVFTSAVGKYKANGFGLYDTTGNVWIWCADWYDRKLYARGDVRDPGPNSGGGQEHRILRGGSWYDGTGGCRAAYRHDYAPATRYYLVGFRVCVVLD